MLRSPRQTPHGPQPALLHQLQTANQQLALEADEALQRVREKWRRGEQLRHRLELLKQQYLAESQQPHSEEQVEVEVYMRTPLPSPSQLAQLEQKFDGLLRAGRELEGEAKARVRAQLRETAEEIRKLRGAASSDK